MPRKSLPGLGQLQARVLEFVWERGEATVADAVQHLGRRRAGYLYHGARGVSKAGAQGMAYPSHGRAAHVYQPARSRESAQAGLLTEMLDGVFAGDPKLLVTHLLDVRPWTPDDLAEMRRLIEARRKEKRHERD